VGDPRSVEVPELALIRMLLMVGCLCMLELGSLERGDPPKPKVEVPADVSVDPGTSRAWALMACSVPFGRDGFKNDLLAGSAMNEHNVEALREYLKLKYGITRRIELVNVLDKLVAEGRRAIANSLFKQIRETKLTEADIEGMKDVEGREELRTLIKYGKRMASEKEGLLAYDYVRYEMLCRIGYGAGYFTEAEAWKRIDPVAKKLQTSYSSWEELGEIYCIGEEFSVPKLGEKTWESWKQLKADEKGPWSTVDWKLTLVSPEKPEKPAAKK
jgi:hypothetical protein